MTNEEFLQFAASRGWKTAGEYAYVIQDGYPFSVRFKGGKMDVATVVMRHTGRISGKLRRALQKAMPKKCSVITSQAGVMTIICAGGSGTLPELLPNVLRSATTLLREHGVAVSEACPICKQGSCDAYADKGAGAYVPAHRRCVEEAAASKTVSAEVNTISGNYVTGILGAIIGSLVATIPSIITIVFFESIYSLLYALVPLGAYYGYKLLRGKMNKAAFYTTIVLSVLQIMVIEQLSFYVEIVRYFGIYPPILETIAFYFEVMGARDMVSSLGMSVLFMGLGVWMVWGQIRRTADHDVRDAGQMLESLIPRTSGRYASDPWNLPGRDT